MKCSQDIATQSSVERTLKAISFGGHGWMHKTVECGIFQKIKYQLEPGFEGRSYSSSVSADATNISICGYAGSFETRRKWKFSYYII